MRSAGIRDTDLALGCGMPVFVKLGLNDWEVTPAEDLSVFRCALTLGGMRAGETVALIGILLFPCVCFVFVLDSAGPTEAFVGCWVVLLLSISVLKTLSRY